MTSHPPTSSSAGSLRRGSEFFFSFLFLPHTVAGSAVYAASDTCITNIDRFKNTVFTSLGRKLLVETEKTKSKMILFRQEQSPCRRTTSHPLPFIIIIRMPLVFCFVVVSVCVCVCEWDGGERYLISLRPLRTAACRRPPT